MPMPPRPGGVAAATMVSVRISDLRLAAAARSSASVGAPGAAAASMRRLMFHCCAIDSTVLVTQYSTSPAGKNAKVTDMASGMIMNTFCCTGSPACGLSLYCTNIAAAMIAGSMKNGSRDDRSWIQNMNGAWRISTLSSSTQ